MEEALRQSNHPVIRIAVVGPESTGKTTLVEALAKHYSTTFAPEYMREYFTQVALRTPFESKYEDLLPIAIGQMAAENKAAAHANKLLFCDTNLLEVECYAHYYFGKCPPQITLANRFNTYHLNFLTFIDVPWQKDELRDRPYDRQKLFTIFEQALKKQGTPHTLLQGNEQERLAAAVKTIDNYCVRLHEF